MNMYVFFAYFISSILMVGELVFTFSCHQRSKRFLQKLEQDNEKEV
jgi:hypothetical protein